jgi:hypothetical protein
MKTEIPGNFGQIRHKHVRKNKRDGGGGGGGGAGGGRVHFSK